MHCGALGQMTSNTQQRIADQICIAQQDLILMLDASGSLKKDGFEAQRTFTGNLTFRYQAQ